MRRRSSARSIHSSTVGRPGIRPDARATAADRGALTSQDTPFRARPFPPPVLPAPTCVPRYSLRMESCPRCGAQRPAALVECPRCGVIYAKAEARAAALEPAGSSAQGAALEDGPDFEGGPALEASIRTWAIPSALLCAFLLVSVSPGRAVVRIFFSMWIHELGHAAAAWLCGVLAVPGPWRTLTASGRSPLFAALLSVGVIY